MNASHLLDFFALLPSENRENEITEIEDALQSVDDAMRMYSNGGQRKLASFDTYFRFGDIVDRFWQETEDERESCSTFRFTFGGRFLAYFRCGLDHLNAEELPAS